MASQHACPVFQGKEKTKKQTTAATTKRSQVFKTMSREEDTASSKADWYIHKHSWKDTKKERHSVYLPTKPTEMC